MYYHHGMELPDREIAKVGVRDGDNIIIRQSWLNQCGMILLILMTLAGTSYVSLLYPEYTTIDSNIGVSIPLLNLIPLTMVLRCAFTIYNERFVITPEYLIDVEGRLAWRERSTRIEYHRVQEIKIEETILQRLFNLGDVTVVPLAGTEGIPICLRGVSHPRTVKDLIRQHKKGQDTV
jgi:membrane protein YdbS with pleckstrin-like domain